MARVDYRVQLDMLKRSQNPDGGWGYFAGKTSWLEPTLYAILALRPDASARESVERGWGYARALQRPDGAWRARTGVPDAHWTTALAAGWLAIFGVQDESFRKGVSWLLDTSGSESGLFMRAIHFLKPNVIEYDSSLRGWPWRAGSASWVEPTAHALFALKKAAGGDGSSRIRARIEEGERMLLDRRCADNAWNYGNRRVLGANLSSFPETTALALHGLQGNRSGVLGAAIKRAEEHYRVTRSSLGRAWLSIVLQNYGVIQEPGPGCGGAAGDLLVASLSAIAASDARLWLTLKGAGA